VSDEAVGDRFSDTGGFASKAQRLDPTENAAMGAEPWDYYVPYREDVPAAMEDLKQQEFAAGRYDRGMGWDKPPAASIGEALDNAHEEGTSSILDITTVSDDTYDPDLGDHPFSIVFPMSDAQLVEHYGTTKPTRTDLKRAGEFPEWVDRGFGVYVIVHDDAGQPSEIYFGGYSFD
jgi:hypothetical protein